MRDGRHWTLAGAAGIALMLTGCVVAPLTAVPGPEKTAAQFQGDDAACRAAVAASGTAQNEAAANSAYLQCMQGRGNALVAASPTYAYTYPYAYPGYAYPYPAYYPWGYSPYWAPYGVEVGVGPVWWGRGWRGPRAGFRGWGFHEREFGGRSGFRGEGGGHGGFGGGRR
jgi:hypothetical protein